LGKLIAILGNCAAGKTSLAKHLAAELGLTPCLEQHAERLYHSQVCTQQLYAVANQVDFLLARAEQELLIRSQNGIGIQDGGLEQDYVIFTQLFYRKGLLSEADFQLCTRLYKLLRTFLPPPDLFLVLSADLPLLEQRLMQRMRAEELAKSQDLAIIEDLLKTWLASSPSVHIVQLNANDQSLFSPSTTAYIKEELGKH